MTELLYLNDTYLFDCEAKILGQAQDDRGAYLVLDRTIFYPQGGGQPSDQGNIKAEEFNVEVTHVRQVDGEIRHYVNTVLNDIKVNKAVSCVVDKNRRLLNARYHTAAHLLGNAVEKIYPMLKAMKGHSFPQEAYLEFSGSEIPDISEVMNNLQQAIEADLATQIFEIDHMAFEEKFYKLPYKIPENKTFRVMQIGDYLPVPCGGTHLNHLAEIGTIKLGKIKAKNGLVRVSYEVT